MPLPIQVVLTESELARDFLTALEQRDIPEKFFYWFPLSVRAWLALCAGGDAAGYRNFDRSRELIERRAREIAERTRPGVVEVISLGAGQGDKDRVVLDALAQLGREVRYRPVDASIGLLEMAVHDAMRSGHATIGVKADFTNADHLASVGATSDVHDGTRMVLMLGNTLGAFDPLELAQQLAALLRAGDLAVVDGELFAGEETLAGYDNPVNRRFALAPLAAAGLTPADGELVFTTTRDARRAGLFRVEKHFTARHDVRLSVAGESVLLRGAERLSMSPSHKYDEPAFLSILKEAHLSPVAIHRSDDGRFVMAIVQQTDSRGQEPGIRDEGGE
jgi:uncharacterized SAM-dependent methyltransferase